jgi:predicted DNA-binding antitoxin AbrB/MazE fold protein
MKQWVLRPSWHTAGFFTSSPTQRISLTLWAVRASFAPMKAIHAIYERGVFRPLEAVDLPETTEVVFEPRPVLPPARPEARARVLEVLAQRFDCGENDVAARHDEHQL